MSKGETGHSYPTHLDTQHTGQARNQFGFFLVTSRGTGEGTGGQAPPY